MLRKWQSSVPRTAALVLMIWTLGPCFAHAQGKTGQAPKGQNAEQTAEQSGQKAQQKITCIVCHSNLGGQLAMPTGPFPTDVHAEKGLTCASCHGGDPTSMDPKVAMSPAKGFRGKPRRDEVPEFCGRCHSDAAYMHKYSPTVQTDEVQQYYTSRHGQLLKQGNLQVATCINCHSVHDIKLVSDPTSPVYPTNVPETCGKCHSNQQYMASYTDLPNLTQVADYEKSVHYEALTKQGDLSAPTCVTCHGSHGATPPGVRSVADVCGTCHAQNLQLFQKSPHAAAFAEMGVPGCVQCHSNHDIHPANEAMLVGPDSVCMSCHQEGDNGAKRAEEMATAIRKLDAAIQQARTTLDAADRAGMDVSGPTAELVSAHSDLVMSRTAIHSLDAAQVDAEIEKGAPIAAKVLQEARDRLAEVQSRRKGVALFSLLVLGIVLSIFFYIRSDRESG
jgi:Cytochrome c3/Cytochrome c554 and c-prime